MIFLALWFFLAWRGAARCSSVVEPTSTRLALARWLFVAFLSRLGSALEHESGFGGMSAHLARACVVLTTLRES
jgi:hypothetical protein